jgi:cell division protein FtsZ
VDLTGARGVLVNITANKSLKMKEVREVMETIKHFADPDAHVIFGSVFDADMGEKLRVTVVATGLGRAQARRADKPQLVPQPMLRTGTDNNVVAVAIDQPGVDYHQLETPAVFRSGRADRRAQVEALQQAGMDKYEIPAFLRKQAD